MDTSKLGANTACLANHELYEAIDQIARTGFDTIELLAFDGARHSRGTLAGFWFGEMTNSEREKLREAVSRFRHVALHLPFIHTHLFTHNPAIRRASLAVTREGIAAAGFLSAEMTVLHVNPRPFMAPREYWEEIISTLHLLARDAEQHNTCIGIETMYPPSIEDFCRLIEDIDQPNVGATIDVGHVRDCTDLRARNPQFGTPEAAEMYNDCLIGLIERLGPEKLFHFHLHDVRASDWRDHCEVGTGIIDFERLFRTLSRMKYEGLLTFELEPDEEAALARSRSLILDIMTNI